ncbi:hypothetical protein ACJJTC_015746 [Scirpophaga incertulas]
MTEIYNIMSIKQMIDAAFGDQNMNVVNHKLIHTILIILARQLRILGRRVQVDIGTNFNVGPRRSVSITEVKLQANVQRMKKVKHRSTSSKEATSKLNIDTDDASGKAGKDLTTGGTFIDKSSTSKSTTDKSLNKSSASKNEPLYKNYQSRLEKIEEKREKEIRVIHQRADSREVHMKTPTPMTSLDSMEKQYEKLLIVGRTSTEDLEVSGTNLQVGTQSKIQRLSIVTKEEFEDLARSVKEIQKRFGLLDITSWPSDSKLLNELREGASLTNAMAALQLSARIDAVEKTLERLLSLLTDLAKITPVVSQKKVVSDIDENREVIIEEKNLHGKKTADPTMSSLLTADKIIINSDQKVTINTGKHNEEAEQDNSDRVTVQELNNAMRDIREEVLKIVNVTTVRSNNYANNALTIASKLEEKLDLSLNVGDRMTELEKNISEYVNKVTALDTGLSSQMTAYQEQINQMQHDLEISMETMQEAIANTGTDTTVVTELNHQFTNLQMDLDVAAMRQKDLKEMQDAFAIEIDCLRKMIEILRESKADRDEVVDALRDKAGLASINGLVSRIEFEAVRGDIQKRIGKAYDKFNDQEAVWQKAIDELLRNLNEKADVMQVTTLQESIKNYLEKFQNKINAHMDLEYETMPKLPAFPSLRPPADGSEAKPPPIDENIQKQFCYPGLPIPHYNSTHICQRYCGGSHTLMKNKLSRIPACMLITPALKQTNTAVGVDGKTYMVDAVIGTQPCIPCNTSAETPLSPPHAAKSESGIPEKESCDTMQSIFDICLPINRSQNDIEISLTPPPPSDYD